jgi:GDP-L-fucose synthase
MDHYNELGTVNIGTGVDLTIRELAQTIVAAVGGGLELQFDATKPDGTLRKLLDVSQLADLGWRASIDLRSGVASTYAWYLEKVA